MKPNIPSAKNDLTRNSAVAGTLLPRSGVMSHPRANRCTLKTTLTALGIFLLTVPSLAAAAGAHRGQAASGAAWAHAKQYKVDGDLARRVSRNPHGTTRVIVTLQPGARLPFEFKRYARSGRLGIINGHVVELPNALVAQLAANPSVFRIHYDRPTSRADYR